MIYEDIAANKAKSWLLIAVFFALIGALSYAFSIILFGAYYAMVFALILAAFMALLSYFAGDSVVLAMSQAKLAPRKRYSHLINTVEGLAIAAGIPAPKVYVIEDSAMNAFATGRAPGKASIAVTTGLLEKLNRTELEGVIGHEMSHIKNYDIRMMLLVAILVSATVLLSDMLLRSLRYGGGRRDSKGSGYFYLIVLVTGVVLALLSPIIAQLIQLAVSRQREYLADANGALLTRYPEGLANALSKISKDKEVLEAANKATAHLYIVNPLRNLRGFVNNMFSTHPPIEERIKRLEAM